MLGTTGRSVIKLRSGSPPLELNNTVQKSTGGKAGMFSAEKCTTYTVGKRHFSSTISEIGFADRVNLVKIVLTEENGKGSSAKLLMRFVGDDRYGILCDIDEIFKGSYDPIKQSYCVPPLTDKELLCYFCRETGSACFFTLSKKKGNMEFVEVVKATHAFVADGESTLNFTITLTNNKRSGLSVEVEGPVKRTLDYTTEAFMKSSGKRDKQIEARALSLFKKGMLHQLLGNDGEDADE